ncbi:MAG TPA: amidohydrolase, partial [Clostridiales bacterium]|nr:amidohydrolase [Clostridiales bacterium]
EEEMNDLDQKIREAALRFAEEEGLTCAFEYRDVFPETRNHNTSVDKIKRACNELNFKVFETPEARRGSEDFGHFLKMTKGAIFYCSFGTDYPAIHTTAYDFDDSGIERIVEVNKRLISYMD